MSARVRAGIAGTGSYVPAKVMTNEDFARLVDTSDEWITQRTGIKERRYAAPDEHCSDLCVRAAERALADSGVAAADLDLIVVGTLTADYVLPAVSCLVQTRIGAPRAGAFDVDAACTGFLTALSTAEAFVAAGRARRVLAIGAETLSRYVDMQDRSTCILFGDGAGAAVVTPYEDCEQGEILETTLGADGSGYELIHMPMGGGKTPHHHPDYDPRGNYIGLRGREVFRFAVTKMTDLIEKVTEGIDRSKVGLLVPHQVNRRIIDSALERLGWDESRCVINIEKYGNTSAASVPIALDEANRAGRLVRGQYVVLVAFGAGLTWGATLLRW
jgi:3-oxoacyl-[acyl-carrier-protein] synthase-3